MTKVEQIMYEKALIEELEAKVEIWQSLVAEAEKCARIGLEPAVGAAYARLGLKSAQKLLAAHKASLETIKRGMEVETGQSV